VQLLGVLVVFAWAFGIAYGAMRAIDRRIPLRIDPEGEQIGLNVAERGASTEILDLLVEMDDQRKAGDFTNHVHVEPHTEVGQIAQQYNRVLDDINAETARREAATEALRQRTASLELLQAITSAANEVSTMTDAMNTAVHDVCRFTGWPLGHALVVDREDDIVVSSDIWVDNAPERFAAFRELNAEQRARAFDRFWRGDGGGNGSGLGLAVVRRLVELDGGETELSASPSGGVDAIVRLPRATDGDRATPD
jgi:nitrogen fixation/metabolism regulation signal transduction histidine kinase